MIEQEAILEKPSWFDDRIQEMKRRIAKISL
jgi:hypothetical protein